MSTDRTIDMEVIHDQIWETIDSDDNMHSAREDLGLSKFETKVYYAYIGLGTFYSMYDMRALLETAKAKDMITDAVYDAVMGKIAPDKESADVQDN